MKPGEHAQWSIVIYINHSAYITTKIYIGATSVRFKCEIFFKLIYTEDGSQLKLSTSARISNYRAELLSSPFTTWLLNLFSQHLWSRFGKGTGCAWGEGGGPLCMKKSLHWQIPHTCFSHAMALSYRVCRIYASCSTKNMIQHSFNSVKFRPFEFAPPSWTLPTTLYGTVMNICHSIKCSAIPLLQSRLQLNTATSNIIAEDKLCITHTSLMHWNKPGSRNCSQWSNAQCLEFTYSQGACDLFIFDDFVDRNCHW